MRMNDEDDDDGDVPVDAVVLLAMAQMHVSLVLWLFPEGYGFSKFSSITKLRRAQWWRAQPTDFLTRAKLH